MSLPTDDTVKLVNAATQGLREVYRMGFGYKKSGVLLMALQPKGLIQAALFDDPAEQAKSAKLIQVMDSINRRMWKGSLTIAASGTRQRWCKQERFMRLS